MVLVGAESEENLSIRYLTSSIEAEGFRAELLAWSDPPDPRPLAEGIRARDPLVVGLSLPFQTRAPTDHGTGAAPRRASRRR